MTTFVLDDWDAHRLRRWDKIAPGHHKARWRMREGEDPVLTANRRMITDGVLVAHSSGLGNLEDLRAFGARQPGLMVVVVSAEDQVDPPSTSRFYFRRAQVRKPDDPGFAACLAAFLEAWARGDENVAFLEPDATPHGLIAVYLLLAGAERRYALEPETFGAVKVSNYFDQHVWDKALEEFAVYAERPPSPRVRWPAALFTGARVKVGTVPALEAALTRAGRRDLSVWDRQRGGDDDGL